MRGCEYDNMQIYVGGASVSDVRVTDCLVRNNRRAGFRFAAADRVHGVRLRAVSNGRSGAGDPKQLAGFVLGPLGVGCRFEDLAAYDTRVGAARTQQYGYYHTHSQRVGWARNTARNNEIAPMYRESAPQLVPRL